MNDNYLWNRSGEPDPEVQELEEILGTLRYKPQPFAIPPEIRLRGNRTFLTRLAIAAAIALVALALGLWVNFNRHRAVPAIEAARNSQIDQKESTPPPEIRPTDSAPQFVRVKNNNPTSIQKPHREPRTLVFQNRSRGPAIRQPALTPEELAEKEQVLLALRLVSAKLNLAQRKAQGLPQPNTIRNQHKTG